MLQQLLTLARNTFAQSIRQPIFIILLLAGVLALILNPSLAAYTLEDDNTLLVDMGLSTIALVCLLIAAFTATSVITDEIENKTVLTVISKPVARPLFVLGKFLGIAVAELTAFVILGIVFLMTVRHGVLQAARDHPDLPVIVLGFGAFFLAMLVAVLGNYLYRWVFHAAAVYCLLALLGLAWVMVLLISPDWRFQSITADFHAHLLDPRKPNLPQIILALALVLQAVLIFAAAAIAASTRLKQVMTLVLCLVLFMLGLVNDSILGAYLRQHPPAEALSAAARLGSWLLRGLYGLVPDLQVLWVADAIKQERPIPLSFVLTASGYSLAYTAALLALAVLLFQRRQVG
ncbi:MAG: hypothetical protein IT442_07305 [Phycisphaeraceae bacterium]|nr:hypothetical protein [Phycisphaeraceae bacterium]